MDQVRVRTYQFNSAKTPHAQGRDNVDVANIDPIEIVVCPELHVLFSLTFFARPTGQGEKPYW